MKVTPMAKNNRGQDGRLRSFRADNASAHNIVVHRRTLFGGDASNNPRFIYAAFRFSKRRVVTFTVSSRLSQQQPIGERA
jgi:hypothetical protein